MIIIHPMLLTEQRQTYYTNLHNKWRILYADLTQLRQTHPHASHVSRIQKHKHIIRSHSHTYTLLTPHIILIQNSIFIVMYLYGLQYNYPTGGYTNISPLLHDHLWTY
ncbi:hypothetical protein V6Z11_D06G127700 [Gossypium hirsutum]